MGQAHILWIYEDAISRKQDNLELTLGSSILKICLNPEIRQLPEKNEIVRSAPLGKLQNGINSAGDIHSSEEGIFIWAGNCLRTLDELTDDEVKGAKRLFEALYKKRIQKQTPDANFGD